MKQVRFFLAACAAVVLTSCASAPPTAAPAATPAPAPAAAPAAAPAEKPVAAPAVSKDYLGENIKLVGFRNFSWQGNLYTVPFYTAEIVTPPSPATKNEALVKPTGKVPDLSEPQFWTPYIASTRPATKDELNPGMVVFAAGDAQARSREDLARTTSWSLLRVKDISNLYKGTVTLEYHDTYWNTWKPREYHVDNIRVVLGEFSTELAQ
jgi:pyruvate/2-oxoglutarate dehydrogenase complex dihydrolipoamide acyltransferase (E2) component